MREDKNAASADAGGPPKRKVLSLEFPLGLKAMVHTSVDKSKLASDHYVRLAPRMALALSVAYRQAGLGGGYPIGIQRGGLPCIVSQMEVGHCGEHEVGSRRRGAQHI